MELIRRAVDFPSHLLGGAVAVGNFDGVHRGHQTLVQELVRQADAVNGPAVVLTFDPHPVQLLRPEKAPPQLGWIEYKAKLLGHLGVRAVIAYPTSHEFLTWTAQQFVERLLVHELKIKALVQGANFFFGKGREGNVDTLRSLCQAHAIMLTIVQPVTSTEQIVSSSRIRQVLGEGDVTLANELLGRPHRVRGTVVHGQARGAKLGFPTANVANVQGLLPAPGVYAGRAWLPVTAVQGAATSKGADAAARKKQAWPAAVHLGPVPTFEEGSRLEVHLIGYSGDCYGATLELDFLSHLRGITKFDSLDALKSQLQADVARARSIAALAPLPADGIYH